MTQENQLLGQRVNIHIERLAYGGDGVGHYKGKVIFVPWSAPGDEIKVEIVEDQPRYARGRIVKVVIPSEDRVRPRCDVFSRCGGCQWQHIEYGAQVRFKEVVFRETLEHVGHLKDLPIEPIIQADQPWEYRQRIQLKVDKSGRHGFYAHGSHDVVPFTYCHISDPHLNESISCGGLPKDNVEIVWNESQGQVVFRRPGSSIFGQVHRKQNQKLVATVVEYVRPQPRQAILELYCGSGNFSLSLAPHVRSFLGIDQNAEAIGQAVRAARDAELDGANFVVGSAEWGLKKAIRTQETVDTLVLDPPREGAKEILDLMALASIHRIVYVSCDPASLARDLQFLTQKGYWIVRARPIDMFPQTYHIESVTELIHL